MIKGFFLLDLLPALELLSLEARLIEAGVDKIDPFSIIIIISVLFNNQHTLHRFLGSFKHTLVLFSASWVVDWPINRKLQELILEIR